MRRFSDVELTSTNFATATSYHAYVKDVVNDVVRRIEQAERQWPFNHQVYTETLVVNKREYAFPSIGSGDAFNTEEIDWDSFFLVKDATLDPEISEKKLPFKDYDEYLEYYKPRSLNVDTSVSTARAPQFIFRTQDLKWGVNLPPDKLYKVRFECWGYPTEMSAYGDTTNIPDRFDWIIRYGCYTELYAQRGDTDMRDRYQSRFEDGLDNSMRKGLLKSPDEFRDGRIGNAG